MKNLVNIALCALFCGISSANVLAQSAPKKNPTLKEIDKQKADSIALEREWEALLNDVESSYSDIQQELDQLDNEEEQIMDWYFTETKEKPAEKTEKKSTITDNTKSKNPPKSK